MDRHGQSRGGGAFSHASSLRRSAPRFGSMIVYCGDLNVGTVSSPAALRTPSVMSVNTSKRTIRDRARTSTSVGSPAPNTETPPVPKRRRAASASALRVVISSKPPRTTRNASPGKNSSRMRRMTEAFQRYSTPMYRSGPARSTQRETVESTGHRKGRKGFMNTEPPISGTPLGLVGWFGWSVSQGGFEPPCLSRCASRPDGDGGPIRSVCSSDSG